MQKVERLCLAALPLLFLTACERSTPTELSPTSLAAAAKKPSVSSPTTTVFATGLLNPRGIAFSKEGDVYVAEGGTGAGGLSTANVCPQDPNPATSGRTGRVSRIDAGHAVPVVTNLPSSVSSLGAVFGPADIAFVGPKLYILENAGCGHGVPDVPASILEAHDGGWSVVADLSAFVHANPVAHIPRDFEPDGDWYSLLAQGSVLYAIDANGGQLVSVKPNSGKIDRVIDFSATQGHIVPTTAAEYHGDFYVGNLQPFPAVSGGSKILDVEHNGQGLSVAATGFTAVLGVDFDKEGRMYVLESFTCAAGQAACFPNPGSGRVTRVNADGSHDVIVSGLTFATSMRFGPDGAMYISNNGYFLPPGAGQMLRVTF